MSPAPPGPGWSASPIFSPRKPYRARQRRVHPSMRSTARRRLSTNTATLVAGSGGFLGHARRMRRHPRRRAAPSRWRPPGPCAELRLARLVRSAVWPLVKNLPPAPYRPWDVAAMVALPRPRRAICSYALRWLRAACRVVQPPISTRHFPARLAATPPPRSGRALAIGLAENAAMAPTRYLLLYPRPPRGRCRRAVSPRRDGRGLAEPPFVLLRTFPLPAQGVPSLGRGALRVVLHLAQLFAQRQLRRQVQPLLAQRSQLFVHMPPRVRAGLRAPLEWTPTRQWRFAAPAQVAESLPWPQAHAAPAVPAEMPPAEAQLHVDLRVRCCSCGTPSASRNWASRTRRTATLTSEALPVPGAIAPTARRGLLGATMPPSPMPAACSLCPAVRRR